MITYLSLHNMAKPIKNLVGIRNKVSSESFNREDFKQVLKNLIDVPSDENLNRLHHIRLWFVHSTKMTEGICKRMQGLTRKLVTPNEEDLQVINDMILACRHLTKSARILVKDYEVLWDEGVIVSEIDDFKKACLRLQEVVYYIEVVYLGLYGRIGVNDLARRN